MKKLIIIIELILVICLLASVSCAKARTESDTASGTMEALSPMIDVVEEKVFYSTEGTGVLLSSDEERMIVRTGEMSLVVENVVTSVNEIIN